MTRPLNVSVRTKAAIEFLRHLGDPDSVPFIDIAADRAGLDRDVVRQWFGPRPVDGRSPELDRFLAEVRRIRGEYIAKAMRIIADPRDKDEAGRGNQLKWVLTRLDRENFANKDPAPLSEKARAQAGAARTGTPLAADHPDVLTSVGDLELPETMQ